MEDEIRGDSMRSEDKKETFMDWFRVRYCCHNNVRRYKKFQKHENHKAVRRLNDKLIREELEDE